MGKTTSRSSIASAIAWGWALEALASSKNVAISLLHDLIATIPPNLPKKLLRSISERVALRCLEELFSSHSAPAVWRPKISLDLSESSEKVLRRILNESAECDVMMGGGGRWKWDVEPFIKHKRVSMPKCALEKLKESIVDGSHPHAELFGVKSGLASVRVAGEDGILMFDGGCSIARNIGVRDEQNDESVIGCKRGRIELESGKVVDEGCEDDGLGVDAKKVKRDASCVLVSADENLVPSRGRQTMEQSLERDIPVSERERCVLSEFRMEIREERLVEDPFVATSHETQHKVSANESDCSIEQTVSVVGIKQKNIADEGKNNSEHLPEPTTPHVAAPPDKAQHKESDCNSEHDSHIKITRRASAEVSQRKNITDGAKDHSQFDYVVMEKRDFLNSKCKLARYCNSTGKDHCLMCNGGGELLICSASDCPLVYHESCMGSKFISYVNGDFYCPYCAYSLHLTEFLELENEGLRLTQDLDSCIRLLEVSGTGISEENLGNQSENFGTSVVNVRIFGNNK